MTSYKYYTDCTLLERGNCWRVIHPKCERYMLEKGNRQAEELYAKLVEAALKKEKIWNQRLTADDKQRLGNCVKFFVIEVQKALGQKIFDACAKKVRRMDEDEVAEVIDKIGDVELLFKQTCVNFERSLSSLVSIYANMFMYTYLEDGQDEVCKMLAVLPTDLLETISNELLDTWYYSLSVRNGKLVVHDHE